MGFHLETPSMHGGTPEQAIRTLYSYMARMVGQLNYALGFLQLPGTSTETEKAPQDDTTTAISERSTNAQIPSARAVYQYAAAKKTTVNGYPLNADVVLSANDVAAVPNTAKINDKPLIDSPVLSAEDVGAATTADINAAIAESESRTADFVVETGSISGWTFRKWHSGRCEMCAREVELAFGAWSTYTSGWSFANADVVLPFSVSDISVNGSISRPATGGNTGIIISIRHVDNTTLRFTVIMTAAGTKPTAQADIIIHGSYH